MKRVQISIWLLIICLCIPKVLMASEEQPLWKLVAKSPLIITGIMNVPEKQFIQERARREYHFLDIEITVLDVLKGQNDSQTIQVKYQAKGRSDAPLPDRVLSLNHEKVILFLEYNDWPDWKGIYFTSHPPSTALQKFSEHSVQDLYQEISKQKELVKAIKAQQFNQDPLIGEVKRLIDQMLDKTEAVNAYNSIVQLGQSAVPAIISCLDDRQELPVKQFVISRPPGVKLVYRPQRLVDVLAAILDEVTGETFGRIYNGGSARERDVTVWGWRVWLGYQARL